MSESTWDRSKQTYWISRHTTPWTVRRASDNKQVADYPTGNHDLVLMKAVCFAENDDVVKTLLAKPD